MKALSPLVAEVLLIAFVVGVGAIIATWVTTFTKSSSATVEKQSSAQITCTYGSIKFLSSPPLTYNSTSGNFTGAVENNGNIALGNVRLQVIYDNSTLQVIQLPRSELSAGDIISFNVQISSNFNIIRVTTNCTSPEVSDEVQRSAVTIVSK